MKQILSTSEVVETIHLEGKPWEVLALAEATFEDAKSALTVDLSVQLRSPALKSVPKHPLPSWLPTGVSQVESTSAQEASLVAREVFHSWVKRIRKAILESKSTA